LVRSREADQGLCNRTGNISWEPSQTDRITCSVSVIDTVHFDTNLFSSSALEHIGSPWLRKFPIVKKARHVCSSRLDQERVGGRIAHDSSLNTGNEVRSERKNEQRTLWMCVGLLRNTSRFWRTMPKQLPLDPRAETPVRADKSSIVCRRWLRQKGVKCGVIPAAA
jgi:hypothetical protein